MDGGQVDSLPLLLEDIGLKNGSANELHAVERQRTKRWPDRPRR